MAYILKQVYRNNDKIDTLLFLQKQKMIFYICSNHFHHTLCDFPLLKLM